MLRKIIKSIAQKLGLYESNKIDGVVRLGSNVTLGKNVTFGGNVFLFKTAPISIGDDTMIACNVIIHTATHNHNKHPMWLERIDRPVKIGQHVWIGAGAIILPGIIIGDYAVVGAGAVVTKNVPTGAIVVGNPARIIKFRDMEMIVQESKQEMPERHTGSYVITEGFIDKELTYND